MILNHLVQLAVSKFNVVEPRATSLDQCFAGEQYNQHAIRIYDKPAVLQSERHGVSSY